MNNRERIQQEAVLNAVNQTPRTDLRMKIIFLFKEIILHDLIQVQEDYLKKEISR